MMKLFGMELENASTNLTYNILQVENYKEIFFDVYEVKLNNEKYPVEKVATYRGNPVVVLPIVVEENTVEYPFVLVKGKNSIVFNENNNTIPAAKDFDFVEDEVENLEDSKREILEQIENAKKEAEKQAEKIKRAKLLEATNEIANKQKILQKTVTEARENLLEEFYDISSKIKNTILQENDIKFGQIADEIDIKIDEIRQHFSEQLSENFDEYAQEFDKHIKNLIIESYNSIQPKIDKELAQISKEIIEKVETIENNLDLKLIEKVDKQDFDDVSKNVDTIIESNIELNDKINKGLNKALSRVGNVDKKVDFLSESIEKKIESVEKNIEIFCEEKIDNIKNETLDITDASRKYLVDLIEESKNNFVQEIRRIKDEKPVEYIVESNGKPQKLEHDQLLAEFDKKIHDKFENYKTDLRKYITYASGGGTNAVQYADGGTINGDLIINGLLKADTYEGVKAQEVSYDNSLLVNGNALSATNVQSAIDELALEKVNIRDLGTNLILFPTTASSELSGFFRLVSSTADSDFNLSAVDVSTPPITSNITPIIVGNLISDAGVIIGQPGLVNITTIGNIRKVSGNRDARFYFEVYKRDITGDETFLCASDPTAAVSSSSYQQFSESALLPLDATFGETDRIVIKYFGIKTAIGGANPVYEFQFGGNDPVRTLFPVPASVTIRDTWRKNGDDIYYNDGNVGIGTSNPDEKLVVDGNIAANDIFSNGSKVATLIDPVRTTLTGDGVTTVFPINGADDLVNPSALIVAIDGILQEPVTNYGVGGGNITFTSPIPLGSKAVVISPMNTIQVGQVVPSDGSVTSEKLANNIDIVSGDLTVNDSLVLNATDYVYGDGAAAAHRTALGGGVAGQEIFQSTTKADARVAIDFNQQIAPFMRVIPTNAGWTSTSSGSGTSIAMSCFGLGVQSANTNNFGSITAYPSSTNGNGTVIRLGTGLGAGGNSPTGAYGVLNFSNTIRFIIHLSTQPFYDNSKQSWAFVIGTQAKNVAGIANLLPSTQTSGNRGYVALKCINGNVVITTQVSNQSSTDSAVIDTILGSASASEGCQQRIYDVTISGGIVTVRDGFTGNVLGTHTGAPTNSVFHDQSAIAFAHDSNAVSTTVAANISLQQVILGFSP
jgi:hypothetical protein